MKLRNAFPVMASMIALLSLGCAGDGGSDTPALRIIEGESDMVHEDHVAQTYALVNRAGTVLEAGVTVPYEAIETPPEGDGHTPHATGPAGSFLSLDWPAEVKNQTFFDHYEMHWNPNGHEPEAWMVPHFDIHGYGIPEADVMEIAGVDSTAPVADRLPAGYVYPGVQAVVPQMGVHAVIPGPAAGPPKTMVLGYWGGKMTFVEPMVTQAELMKKQSFEMEILVPAELGRVTKYPTRFRAIWEPSANQYRFVYDNFVSTAK
ncbi:hypothetical protein EON81_12685 [bacterium]|nr:MAG: hypothetical protein EON81_12685 [bacterium]